jgi:hypothetical protein
MANLYLVDVGSNGLSNLYTLNPNNAPITPTLIGAIGYRVIGLAIHPATGVLYGATSTSGPSPNSLISINRTSGAGTLLGHLGVTFNDLNFVGSSLYGITIDGSLYLISISPVSISGPIGSGIPVPSGSSLGNGGTLASIPAGNPDQNPHITSGSSDGSIGNIYVGNGAVTSLVALNGYGGAVTYIKSSTFDNATGQFLALFGTNLVSIDYTNGGVTTLGQIRSSDGTILLPFAIEFDVTGCIHGSSNVQVDTETLLPISELKLGDRILGADGRESRVEHHVACWLGLPGASNFHEAIIFEPGSLGSGIPTQLFAIDPGHPMCTPEEFRLNGINGLKKARDYLNSTEIRLTRWDETARIFPGLNIRYDIVMPKDSCGAYIANGVVVKSRLSIKDAGYLHEEA